METIKEIELFEGDDYVKKDSYFVKQVPYDYSEDIGFLRILYDVVSTRYRELEELENNLSTDNLIKYGYADKGPTNKFFFKRFDKRTKLTIDEKIKVEKYFWIRVLSDFYRGNSETRDKFQLKSHVFLGMLQSYMKTFIDKRFSKLQKQFDKDYEEQLEAGETLQEKNLEKVVQEMMVVNNFDLDTSFLYFLRNLYKFSIITVTRGNTVTRVVRFPTLDKKSRKGIADYIDDPLVGQEKSLIKWHTERYSDGNKEKGINAYANSLLDSAKNFLEKKIEFKKNMLSRSKYLLLYKKEVISIMEKSERNFMVLKALCVRHMTRKFKDEIEALDNDGEQLFKEYISRTLSKKRFDQGLFMETNYQDEGSFRETNYQNVDRIVAFKPKIVLATILGIDTKIKINDKADSPNSYIILTLERAYKRPGSLLRKKKLYQPLKY
ncbi:MAG: hypothetical protein CMO44_18035 [Verrucomicrobiales bacterium]|nr:hypothetical protein [Verrucomicrobiales bacterium]